jgi:hypothetical protein
VVIAEAGSMCVSEGEDEDDCLPCCNRIHIKLIVGDNMIDSWLTPS